MRTKIGGGLNYPDYRDNELTIRNWVRPRRNTEDGNLELHAPLANYEGPGTDIQRRLREKIKPTSKTDRAAMRHDIDYYNVRAGLRNYLIGRPKAKTMIRNSDNRLIAEAKKNLSRSFNPVEKMHAAAALAGITAKNKAEDMGIIDELKFVGKGKKDPLRKLKREFLLKKKPKFIPRTK